ncbi:MAG: hypothetical protein LBF51_03915, partial [Zoogloeaceae bacterium]|nr:hypothetical protein [Zoogloeaceae bacterium]
MPRFAPRIALFSWPSLFLLFAPFLAGCVNTEKPPPVKRVPQAQWHVIGPEEAVTWAIAPRFRDAKAFAANGLAPVASGL